MYNKTYFFLVYLIFNLNLLFADIVTFKSGKALQDVKIKVGRESVDIFFKQGQKETVSKVSLKSVKLVPITWNIDNAKSNKILKRIMKKKKIERDRRRKEELEQNKERERYEEQYREMERKQKEEKEKNENIEEKEKSESKEESEIEKGKIEKLDRKKILEQEMAKLTRQRDSSFGIPSQILEERKRHDSLMKERIRLQYTEGFLTYAGGQEIYTEIMERIEDIYYVRNKFGLLYFKTSDFGDEIKIETDKGKETIDTSKMLAVKDLKYKKDYIYLTSGEKFIGKIENQIGNQVIIRTQKGVVEILDKEIQFPKLTKENKVAKVNIKDGDLGEFVFGNGQVIKGKLVKMSKLFIIIETAYGIVEMDTTDLVSATKKEASK